MPQKGIIYRILIASPSDVVQERKAIPEVIHRWNAINSLNTGIIIEPVLWETHATPEMGDRPQAIINKQLVQNCDILIGTLWTRLGTSTGTAESGTVEEIQEFIRTGKPVLLYFSSIPVVPESVDPGQYKRLLDFKQKCKKEGLFHEYESIGELREKLHHHITSNINKLHNTQGKVEIESESYLQAQQQTNRRLLKTEFESFVRRLEAEWNAERDSQPYNIEDGKYILDRACSDILDLRAQIPDGNDKLPDTLNQVIKSLKAIQRHRLVLDGGLSFKAFWNEGDRIINLLKNIPAELENR